MRFSQLLFVLSAATTTLACQADLGACNDDRARQPVLDQDGVPAYEGQALLQSSCGNGSFCHSAGVTGENRLGAPHGLDFDMALASLGAGVNEAGTRRLRSGQQNVSDWRHEIYDSVESGAMPPFGEATLTAHAGVPRWRRLDGSGLPGVDTIEGLDILQNWLACGAPVVERTEGMSTGIGDVVPRRIEPMTPDATWTAVWTEILEPRCGSSCHGPTVPDQLMQAQLDLSEKDAAYAALVGVGAMGAGCSMMGTRVVADDPEGSLLVQKLEGTATCGSAMPLGRTPLLPEQLVAIRAWIAAGAMDD